MINSLQLARTDGNSVLRFRALALVVLTVLACAWLTSSAHAAGAQTQIVTPKKNQVVGNGRVNVVVRSTAQLGNLRITVNGHNVKRYFRRSNGAYRATLTRGSGLQPGIDQLVVTGAGFARVRFIVARPAKLVTQARVQIGGNQALVRVAVRVAAGSTLQVWVNGHRDEGAFRRQGGTYVGRLGAHDFLRPGRNRVVVLTYRTGNSGRSAVFGERAVTFNLERGRLAAGAGEDRIINAGDFIRLDGTATRIGGGRPRGPVSFTWQIIGRPAGSRPTLLETGTPKPGFVARAAGTYRIRIRVKTANGPASFDTVTVTVREDVPPIGTQLDTVADDRGTIKKGGVAVPNTTEPCGNPQPSCNNYASYAIYNRETLGLPVASGFVTAPKGITDLLNLATKYSVAPSYLMVVNMVGAGAGSPADGRKLLDALGVAKMSDADLNRLFTSTKPISIIGVPGSPPGSAFISNSFLNRPAPARQLSNMTGYVRLNPTTPNGNFEFVFADQLEFDTNASSTPSQITVKLGGQTRSYPVPTDGSAGFIMLRVNSQTLAIQDDFRYVTNKPDGSENPAEAKRMADDIAWASSPGNNDRGELMVMLQAFGKPKGTSTGWLQAAQAISKLGGNAQVFAQLNRAGDLERTTGRYAFVGRAAMDTAAAESSQALTGQATDGRLHGLLARGRDSQYEPLLADGTGAVNFDMVRIVNRPTASGGGFPAFTGGQAAAADFLGRDPDVVGVCDPDPAAPCDIRKAYYERTTGTDWATILTRLGSSATTAKCAAPHVGFNTEDCEGVRQELETEIGRRNTVETYFGPKGLQAPFLGTAQVAALVNISSVAEEVTKAVQPPGANNTASNALTIISYIVKIGGVAGVSFPPAGAAAAGVGAAFSLAAYLTHQDGSPDLIGPQVRAAAAKLGSDLNDRYTAASNYFSTEADIIMSDYTKMTEVAAAIPTKQWALEKIATNTARITLATKQAIYQALIPVAYPFLYDLGTKINHATEWVCRSPTIFLVDKHLFQNTGVGAEIKWKMTDPQYLGQDHLLVIGAQHATGNLHGAYIPAPPGDLTDKLFRDPADPKGGGIGLFKLAFYSPQYFRVFPKVFQQTKPKRGDFGYHTCQSFPDPPGNSQ